MSKIQIYLEALLNLKRLLPFCVFSVDDALSITVMLGLGTTDLDLIGARGSAAVKSSGSPPGLMKRRSDCLQPSFDTSIVGLTAAVDMHRRIFQNTCGWI